MSEKIKLSSKLPGDESVNGLDAYHDDLVKDDAQPIFIAGWAVARRVIKDREPHGSAPSEVPVLELRRVEVLGTTGTIPQPVVAAFLKAQETRLNREPLPIDEMEPPKAHEVLDDEPETVVEMSGRAAKPRNRRPRKVD